MRHRILISLAVCACALAGALPAQASFPGANGQLLYDHHYAQPPDSIGTTDFNRPFTDEWWCCYISTGPVVDARNPAWSPDGTQIAFDAPATELGSRRALYVMNADETGLRQVGRGDRLRYNPAWSPDGGKLAFVQDNGQGSGSGDIYTITTGGANLKRLTTSGAWDGSPDWSGDNRRIAYVCRSGGRSQVCQMTPTGTSKTVTTAKLALPGNVIAPSWSPTSADLAFSVIGANGGYDRVYRMSRSGGSLRELTPQLDYGPIGPAVWSPDGQRIAYDLCNAGECEITTVSAVDGTDAVRVIGNDSEFELDPGGWQPLR